MTAERQKKKPAEEDQVSDSQDSRTVQKNKGDSHCESPLFDSGGRDMV